jgi:hypothetical protein
MKKGNESISIDVDLVTVGTSKGPIGLDINNDAVYVYCTFGQQSIINADDSYIVPVEPLPNLQLLAQRIAFFIVRFL